MGAGGHGKGTGSVGVFCDVFRNILGSDFFEDRVACQPARNSRPSIAEARPSWAAGSIALHPTVSLSFNKL